MVLKREKYQLTVLLFKTIENIGARAYAVMRNIFKIVSVLSVTDEDIQTAFEKRWKDFENNEEIVLLPEQWLTRFTK